MSTSSSPIYSLLPAVFRTSDAAQGGPLQALFEVLETQYGLVKENVWQLYNDQFIETCAPWVIPYIGQLIGYSTVYTAALASPDSRAEVANTIGYRRRKGTLVAIEEITHDVSGRTTMAVEEFRRLVTTLSLRDVRPWHDATANLRRGRGPEDQSGPFNRLNRTIDVRNITPRIRMPLSPDAAPLEIALHGPGRFNIPEVAIWMWRWQSWTVTNAPAFALGGGGYFFSSLGGPVPLFQTTPQEPAPFSNLVTEADVPEPIRRRRACACVGSFYPGSMALIADGGQVPASQIIFANLTERLDGSVCSVPDGMIAIDPELGRIQYAADLALPADLRVNYNYGAPAEIGGGPYDRTANVAQPGMQPGSEFANSSSLFWAVVGTAEYPTLESAVAAWNQLPPNSAGTIALPNFECYEIDLTGANAIHIPAESSLMIASAEIALDGAPEWNNACVTLRGNIEIVAPPVTLGQDGLALPTGQVLIGGVWLSGQLILSGDEACVQVADSTLVPGIAIDSKGNATHPGEPSVTGTALAMTLCLNRVVTGPIALPNGCSARICGSIVDAGSPYCPAIAGSDLASPGPTLHIENSTVIGRVWAQAIRMASNTIFYARLGRHDPWAAPVWAARVQVGCVRFCWLPASSITPRRYECLPPNAQSQPALEPNFITLQFGKPGYCLLSGDVPMAVWKGADNGSQIGVFYQIQETEAVTNIQIRSAEYLPANLECGVFLIPSRPLIEEVPYMEYGYGIQARPSKCGASAAEEPWSEEQDVPIGIGIGLI
ncbi:MAG: hypothetical protein ACRD3N_13125 [Terracidiphilus sp.]